MDVEHSLNVALIEKGQGVFKEIDLSDIQGSNEPALRNAIYIRALADWLCIFVVILIIISPDAPRWSKYGFAGAYLLWFVIVILSPVE